MARLSYEIGRNDFAAFSRPSREIARSGIVSSVGTRLIIIDDK